MRRIRRRKQTHPLRDFIAGQGLGNRRQLGKYLRALGAGGGNRAQLADLGLMYHARPTEVNCSLAAQSCNHRRAAALVRHMRDVDVGLLLEKFSGEMCHRKIAGGSEGDLSRAALGSADQITHGSHRHRRMHHQRVIGGIDQAHGREIFHRVVRQLRARGGQYRVRPGGAEQQCVAIGRGFGNEFSADASGCARAIINHDLPAGGFGQCLCEYARGGVGAAAGRERHDQAYRFDGVTLCVCGCGKGQCRNREPVIRKYHNYLFLNNNFN